MKDGPNRRRAIRALGKIMPSLSVRRGDTLHLSLTGKVGEIDRRSRDGFTAIQIEAALLANPTVSHIHVEIDSDGGYANEAFDIYSALRGHGGYVTTCAGDMCASAATIVLMAGDHREAHPFSKILLHRAAVKPSTARWTASLHRKVAQSLDAMDTKIVCLYESRAGGNRVLFEREMQSETALPVAVAKAWGFIDCFAGEALWRQGRPYLHAGNRRVKS